MSGDQTKAALNLPLTNQLICIYMYFYGNSDRRYQERFIDNNIKK